MGIDALNDLAVEPIRRECVDHIVVWGEGHLRWILRAYARYYNNIRTHRSLDKDAPAFRPTQRIGNITSQAILGGLHHRYVRRQLAAGTALAFGVIGAGNQRRGEGDRRSM